MELQPRFEQPKNPEQEKEELIKLLEKNDLRGDDNTEAIVMTRERLNDWLANREKEVEQLTDDEYCIGQIELNRELACLYLAAGYTEEARSNFDAAQMQAWQEGRDELYHKITEEIESIFKE